MKKWFALCTSVAVIALAGPAGAAGTVTIAGSNRTGDTLTVNGASTYTDQPFVTVGTDPAGDVSPALDANGADVTAAAIATALSGQVKLQWTLNSLPPSITGSPAIMFGWDFCAGSEDNCFELDLQRFSPNASAPNPHAVLWRCADPSCDPGGQSRAVTGGMPITFDATTKTVTVTLPAVANGTPGSTFASVQLDANGPAFTTIGTADPFTAQYGLGDGVAAVADFTIAKKEVSVAVAAPGLDPASVAYGAPVSPAATGSWTAALNVAGQSGERGLYARACFGTNNCAYTTQAITL
jgi:hypothetical protein